MTFCTENENIFTFQSYKGRKGTRSQTYEERLEAT